MPPRQMTITKPKNFSKTLKKMLKDFKKSQKGDSKISSIECTTRTSRIWEYIICWGIYYISVSQNRISNIK